MENGRFGNSTTLSEHIADTADTPPVGQERLRDGLTRYAEWLTEYGKGAGLYDDQPAIKLREQRKRALDSMASDDQPAPTLWTGSAEQLDALREVQIEDDRRSR